MTESHNRDVASNDELAEKFNGDPVTSQFTYVAMSGCVPILLFGHHAIVLTECLWPSKTTTALEATRPGMSSGLDIPSTSQTRAVMSSEHEASRVPEGSHLI